MARRRFRATALCLSLLPALTAACGEDPIDNNNNFTSNGDDLGTAGTDDDVGSEDATSDASSDDDDDDASSSTTTGDGDGDPSDTSDDDPSDSTSTTTDTGETGECSTPTELVGSSCGQNTGIKGPVAQGQSIGGPLGGIEGLDNGLGNGEEDWYQFEFPVVPAAARPLAGTPTINFVVNDGSDYRFEVYRDCGAEAYGQGLASEFGSNSPPLTEWSFNDVDPGMVEQLQYMEMVPWPSTIWVRVFRFQNDGECNNYQLQITRP